MGLTLAKPCFLYKISGFLLFKGSIILILGNEDFR